MVKSHKDTHSGESGYSWLYNASALNSRARVLITLLVITLSAGFFAWYTRFENDASPDSLLGYAYAVIGTVFLLLAAVLFSLRRRSHRRRQLCELRSSLGWHMCFALMGLAFLGMHSFGELNPRTGTYALYGMIALVISGLVGRGLDRLVPRLIAGQVHRTLDVQRDDCIEIISQRLQDSVEHDTRDKTDAKKLALAASGQERNWRDRSIHIPWDLGYLSLNRLSRNFIARSHPTFPQGVRARQIDTVSTRRNSGRSQRDGIIPLLDPSMVLLQPSIEVLAGSVLSIAAWRLTYCSRIECMAVRSYPFWGMDDNSESLLKNC